MINTFEVVKMGTTWWIFVDERIGKAFEGAEKIGTARSLKNPQNPHNLVLELYSLLKAWDPKNIWEWVIASIFSY